ncbi:MAG: hypothetical protein ACLUDO_05735 [Anaerostipes hadrus]
MKKRIIKIIIILLITIAFIGVAVYLTTGFLNKREVKQDIETTLDSIKSGDANQERYIYEVQMTASNTDNSSKENLITSKITFKIQKIKINKKTATVTIKFVYPDCTKIIKQKTKYNSAKELQDYVKNSLESKYPQKKEVLKVKAKKVGDHWYIVSDQKLSNVYSGNLRQYYIDLQKKLMEEMMKK